MGTETEWNDFLQHTTWRDLFDEIAESVSRLDSYRQMNPHPGEMNQPMADLFQGVISLSKYLSQCAKVPGMMKQPPAPQLAERVLATARKVRLILPEVGHC